VKRRLLDLFSGAGGAAMGYARAGFEVVGVDNRPQPRYPFEFVRDDALAVLANLDVFEELYGSFDLIHASPPCQLFSRAGKLRDAQGGKASTVNLVPETRDLLRASGRLYVIENVPGAPLIDPTLVCGSAFGLLVRRHRLFESNVPLPATTCRHKEQGRPVGVYHVMGDSIPHGGKTAVDLAEGQRAMGIDWMTWDELKEAVPPAYTEHIGRQLLAAIEDRAA
jgi:DNA (cytosine-5)-methyltransferase 1